MAKIDAGLQPDIVTKQPNAKNGLIGLRNIGNTCYLASSIQCLSNCYELTKFFLDQKYKPMTDLPDAKKNPLGTNGRLVLAYAKLLNEMWNMNS